MEEVHTKAEEALVEVNLTEETVTLELIPNIRGFAVPYATMSLDMLKIFSRSNENYMGEYSAPRRKNTRKQYYQ